MLLARLRPRIVGLAALAALGCGATRDEPPGTGLLDAGPDAATTSRPPRGPGAFVLSPKPSRAMVVAARDGAPLSERDVTSTLGPEARFLGAGHAGPGEPSILVWWPNHTHPWFEFVRRETTGATTALAVVPGDRRGGIVPARLGSRWIYVNEAFGSIHAVVPTGEQAELVGHRLTGHHCTLVDSGPSVTDALYAVEAFTPSGAAVAGFGVSIRRLTLGKDTAAAGGREVLSLTGVTTAAAVRDPRRNTLWVGVHGAVVGVGSDSGKPTGVTFALPGSVDVTAMVAAPCQDVLFVVSKSSLHTLFPATGQVETTPLPALGQAVTFSDEAQTVAVALDAEPGFALFGFDGAHLAPRSWSGPKVSHAHTVQSFELPSCK